MVFKESVGESIRLGDELVSIDGVPVDGKLAADCEAAVKKSTRLTAIPFGTGLSTHLRSFWILFPDIALDNGSEILEIRVKDPKKERSVNKMTTDVDTVVRLTRGNSGKFNFRLKHDAHYGLG